MVKHLTLSLSPPLSHADAIIFGSEVAASGPHGDVISLNSALYFELGRNLTSILNDVGLLMVCGALVKVARREDRRRPDYQDRCSPAQQSLLLSDSDTTSDTRWYTVKSSESNEQRTGPSSATTTKWEDVDLLSEFAE